MRGDRAAILLLKYFFKVSLKLKPEIRQNLVIYVKFV